MRRSSVPMEEVQFGKINPVKSRLIPKSMIPTSTGALEGDKFLATGERVRLKDVLDTGISKETWALV
ncbi:hypothetical protein C5167_041839 [Papaver somniferum]|nr:hypothetical protein C5167_041839 [Papaver somniferum]